jgi:D-alanine-D-alanine ligase
LEVDHPDAESEHSVVDVAEDVAAVLRQAGFRSALLGLKEDPVQLVAEMRRQKPAAVFNLHEGSMHNGDTEAYVAGMLEWLEVPFTGAPFQTLTLARAKHLTKRLLVGAGLPTPAYYIVDRLPVPRQTCDWPVIIKPALQDASVGLDQDSVVTNQRQLERRVAFILEEYGPPVLVEEFIGGRELNVGLIENPALVALPPSEILFQKGSGTWPILTYAGKWHTDSPEFIKTPPRCPADLHPRLADRVARLAKEAYRLLGCRDYARIDFRIGPSGKPHILEVNPNPDISDEAGFTRCLAAAGISRAEFIVHLARSAIARTPVPRHIAMAGYLALKRRDESASTATGVFYPRPEDPGLRDKRGGSPRSTSSAGRVATP